MRLGDVVNFHRQTFGSHINESTALSFAHFQNFLILQYQTANIHQDSNLTPFLSFLRSY